MVFFFFELWREALGPSRVVMGTSGNLFCYLKEVRPPYKLCGVPQDFSRFAAGKYRLISS